jgi:hypothetical protein
VLGTWHRASSATCSACDDSGPQELYELDPIVSPDTLLRWHRQLIAICTM